ncbi:MAG: cysteine peptidase family C39 domain-containing protein [Planctomycetota bacterium]
MLDLIIAACIVAALSLMTCILGYRLGRIEKHWPSIALLIATGLLYGLYLLFVRDSVLLVQLLPLSAVPILGDPTPWMASLAAGLLLAQHRVMLIRRAIIAGLVVAMGWHGPVRALTTTPPETYNTWNQGVCLQSTFSTCGPAALATLLKQHGVKTDETTMARLCLTNDKGTHLTGLYRGLTLKAPAGTAVHAAQLGVDELIATPERLPAVASLMLTRELAEAEPRYVEDWGWDVGVMHVVTLLAVDEEGYVLVADPGVGPERWNPEGLRELWIGEVLYLARDD